MPYGVIKLNIKLVLFNADFFYESDDKFGCIGEEVNERLNFIHIRSFIDIEFQSGAARIVIQTSVNIIPGIFPASLRPVGIYRAKVVFQQYTHAVVGFDKPCLFVCHKCRGTDSFGFLRRYYRSADDLAAPGALLL